MSVYHPLPPILKSHTKNPRVLNQVLFKVHTSDVSTFPDPKSSVWLGPRLGRDDGYRLSEPRSKIGETRTKEKTLPLLFQYGGSETHS